MRPLAAIITEDLNGDNLTDLVLFGPQARLRWGSNPCQFFQSDILLVSMDIIDHEVVDIERDGVSSGFGGTLMFHRLSQRL